MALDKEDEENKEEYKLYKEDKKKAVEEIRRII